MAKRLGAPKWQVRGVRGLTELLLGKPEQQKQARRQATVQAMPASRPFPGRVVESAAPTPIKSSGHRKSAQIRPVKPQPEAGNGHSHRRVPQRREKIDD